MPISRENCVPIELDILPLDSEGIADLLIFVPTWEVVETEQDVRLRKSFPFEDWPSSLEFITLVANQATFENHHPVLTLNFGRVSIDWWSHRIFGLHRNDFVMACRTDHVFEDFQSRYGR